MLVMVLSGPNSILLRNPSQAPILWPHASRRGWFLFGLGLPQHVLTIRFQLSTDSESAGCKPRVDILLSHVVPGTCPGVLRRAIAAVLYLEPGTAGQRNIKIENRG